MSTFKQLTDELTRNNFAYQANGGTVKAKRNLGYEIEVLTIAQVGDGSTQFYVATATNIQKNYHTEEKVGVAVSEDVIAAIKEAYAEMGEDFVKLNALGEPDGEPKEFE